MKKAIQFGGGNIGRGFIGAVLSKAGYHVVFADVNENLLSSLNAADHYTVHIMDSNSYDIEIKNFSAVNSGGDQIVNEICEAEIITTAVGLRILQFVAPAIAKGIGARKERGIETPLNIVACENGIRATSVLKEEVYKHLGHAETRWADIHVGFADCSVDRIVPPVRSENPIDVVVEEYYEWNVERDSLIEPIPEIPGMNLADNLLAYIERKLCTLNTGHCITAYLGYAKGYATIDEAIEDPEIFAIVKAAMQESGENLVKKFGFDHDTHFHYIDKIIARFKNPYLKDDVTRVGREPLRKLSGNDRLILPAKSCVERGLPCTNLVKGIVAALRYDNEADPQSVEIKNTIASVGVKKAFCKFSGLDE
ncbi:MAG: mannitol-1-phosphate 5-dehydrogenase, partial [Bacteroidales bacterium]|nr:mannitol-1-phosphate 5-dehydrogenase [Bacteroidales bacterium]